VNTLAQQQYYQPLIWIKPELDKTIKNIRILLEEYSLDLENNNPLEKINEELHLLKGSLEILEFFGAGLLTDDMSKATGVLINNQKCDKKEIFEALLQATLSIDAYIDKLHKDHNDIPLALLPIANDVRASINEPLLSESALFLPNLSIVPKTPESKGEDQLDIQLNETAKSLRPYYQAALLTWIKDSADQLSIQQLKLVVRNLESASTAPRNRQIWWILGGIFEALSDKGLKSNVALRLILGQADRIIKALGHDGEDVFEKNPPVDLLKNALYYISQSTSNGKRVETLKRVYQLDRVLPSEKDLSALRHTLNAPNSNTLTSIAKELKKSLDQSKAIIDNFSRNTPEDTDRLENVITPLKHIADTLTLLSLSDEKNLLNSQIQQLESIVNSGIPPSKETMLSIATSLLQVDSTLQNINNTSKKKQDWQLSKSKPNTGDEMSNNGINNLPETEYRLLIIKTAMEAKHNIEEVKNNILAYLASDKINKNILKNIPNLLTEIQGSLTISNNDYASSIVSALNQLIQDKLLDNSSTEESIDLDLLAEIIVSIEYYLEAIAEERTPTTPILEKTQENLSNLGYSVLIPKNVTKNIPILEAVVTHISEAPTRLKVNALSLPKMESTLENKSPEVLSITPDEIDEEVVEIFIEEAFEELTEMTTHLQSLRLNPNDEDALSNIRRAYHTLKGSGKIAGANDISDFSCQVEEYLSHVLCGAQSLNQDGIILLNNCQQFLFELTDCFKNKNPAPEELAILSESITSAMGRKTAAGENESEIASDVENIDVAEINPQTSQHNETTKELDDILKSAVAQVNIIEEYIGEFSNSSDLSSTPAALHDAILELHHCAEKTNIAEFIQTTDLLAKYINNINKNSHAITIEAVEILKEFCITTREILNDLPNLINFNSSKLPEHTLPIPIGQVPTDVLEQEKPSVKEVPKTIFDEPQSFDTDIDDDIDLITIFMEEAIDLIGRGNTILQDYETNQDNDALLSSSQRLLHTMKGSARMAGVTSVGNLAHTQETLIELIITNEIEQPDNLIELIQASFDAINDIIEDIQSNNDIRMHHDLLEQLEALSHPQIDTLGGDSEIISLQENEATTKIPDTDISNELLNLDNTTEELNETNKDEAEAPTDNVTENTLESIDFDSENITMDSTTTETIDSIDNDETPTTVDETIERDIDYPSTETVDNSSTEEVTPTLDTGLKKENIHDVIRVNTETLDSMINIANEGSAANLRIDDHIHGFKTNLLELDKTISRSLAQMRDLQFETQQIKKSSSNDTNNSTRDGNDLNIFSEEQKTIQRLMESIGDIENIHSTLTRSMLEADNLFHQQKKLQSMLYENLLNTRMVTFSIQTQRMQRILRQTCKELKKKATLTLEGTDGAIDRSLLEKLMGPMEHIIRNAVAHGIESPNERKLAHKSKTGNVKICFSKDKSEHLIEIHDDGAGIDVEKVRKKAIAQGLVDESEDISDDDLKNIIFESGFSTSNEVSQISGRGVGMDVVLNEIQQLGGTVSINSQAGTGSSFCIRVPFTSSRNHTLFVTVANNTYALPSSSIVHSFSADQGELEKMYTNSNPTCTFENNDYPLWHMNALLNKTETFLPDKHQKAFVILIQHNHKLLALQVDEINETRDSVLQPTNPLLSELQGIAGTTVLGNGKVVLIIDVPAIIKLSESSSNKPKKIIYSDSTNDSDTAIKALIVDDSVTVRKITERFLNRHGINTATAKDGVEALEKIQEDKPDVILLDIEMPNMDGLELAKNIKSDTLLHNTPIVMITSRTGQHHRQTANEIGVEVFLGKPYQESELLGYIQALTGKRTHKNV